MQVHEFRRELQDAILRLQRIAQKIDDDHLKETTFNDEEKARNIAVAQARREIEAGVTHPDVVSAPLRKAEISIETVPNAEQIAEHERIAEKRRKVIEARQAAAKAQEK